MHLCSQCSLYPSFFSDNCHQLEFRPNHTFDDKRLKNHAIHTVDVMDGDFCETVCYIEPICVSYNLKTEASENGKYQRETNNSTFECQKDKLEKNSEYTYRGAKVRESLKIKFKSGEQTKTDKKSSMASKKKCEMTN